MINNESAPSVQHVPFRDFEAVNHWKGGGEVLSFKKKEAVLPAHVANNLSNEVNF